MLLDPRTLGDAASKTPLPTECESLRMLHYRPRGAAEVLRRLPASAALRSLHLDSQPCHVLVLDRAFWPALLEVRVTVCTPSLPLCVSV